MKRAGHPFWDFVKAAVVITGLMVILSAPLFMVITGAVLFALWLAGVGL